jgi:hypothetical protein
MLMVSAGMYRFFWRYAKQQQRSKPQGKDGMEDPADQNQNKEAQR